MFLKGKTALITGSTSGIGAAYATELARNGAAVMINGFGDPAEIDAQLAELRALSGTTAAFTSADLAHPAGVQQMLDDAARELGSVDILINNAGVQHVCPVDEFPVEKWDQIIAIMLTAPFLLIRGVVPQMRAKGWGRIISTASAHSLTASPNKSAYVSAKHGLTGLTKTVALETARDGITVNCISPGYVWTPLVEKQIPDTMKTRNMTREQVLNDVLLASSPQRSMAMPEEIAALALFLCRDEAKSITGANYSVDGGWTAQ
jgi:3-hydroxybutyrate dehydrogenase